MTEQYEAEAEAVEAEPQEGSAPARKSLRERDQERIERYAEALESMPTEDDMNRLRQDVAEAEKMVETAREALEREAVRRALVIGWTEAADEMGVIPRVVHGWRRKYALDAEDLSTVPTRELPREEKRIEAEREEAKAIAERQQMIERHRDRMNRIKEGQ